MCVSESLWLCLPFRTTGYSLYTLPYMSNLLVLISQGFHGFSLTPPIIIMYNRKGKSREAYIERSAVATRVVETESFEHGNLSSYAHTGRELYLANNSLLI